MANIRDMTATFTPDILYVTGMLTGPRGSRTRTHRRNFTLKSGGDKI